MIRAVLLLMLSTGTADAAVRAKQGSALPYSCETVRMAVATFGQAQLDAMAKANGVVLTAAQKQQVRACLRVAR